MPAVPVLMSVRNEEILIKKALASIVRAIVYYKDSLDDWNYLNAGPSFPIYVCDNNSSDNTKLKIREFMNESARILAKYNIGIKIIDEKKQGKVYALRALINCLENDESAEKFDNVIFTDGDIQWETNFYYEMVTFKKNNPSIKLIGTKLIPDNKKINFWGKAEVIPYYGYGESANSGHGTFSCFISGMGYMADKSVLHYLKDEIPPVIGNEDVALSVLIGKENIHILNSTGIYYYVSENLVQFIRIRGRHIREQYRIFRWLKKWKENNISKDERAGLNKASLRRFARNWARMRFYSITECRSLPYLISFYKSTRRFNLSGNFLKWLESIPAVQEGMFFFLVFYPSCLAVYLFVKIIFYIQSLYHNKAGWEPVRSFD
jgi:cellulose synthase/poly-beta-1,6-N-acetylglucosamine synthase-like glycosyltransferase